MGGWDRWVGGIDGWVVGQSLRVCPQECKNVIGI